VGRLIVVLIAASSAFFSMTKLGMPKCRNEPISEFLSDFRFVIRINEKIDINITS